MTTIVTFHENDVATVDTPDDAALAILEAAQNDWFIQAGNDTAFSGPAYQLGYPGGRDGQNPGTDPGEVPEGLTGAWRCTHAIAREILGRDTGGTGDAVPNGPANVGSATRAIPGWPA